MKRLILILLVLPSLAHASFMMQYGLNYSSQVESSSTDYTFNRTFHKLFLGASVNGRKTLFLGWNTHLWNSTIEKASVTDTYSLTEMGPRLIYFFSDDYNFYISGDWNPYAVGTRKKGTASTDIRGSSMDFAFGYRYKINRLMGLGAAIHYHMMSLGQEKTGTTETSSSDTVNNIMPMLEFTLITR